jgi:hypothetical protein
MTTHIEIEQAKTEVELRDKLNSVLARLDKKRFYDDPYIQIIPPGPQGATVIKPWMWTAFIFAKLKESLPAERKGAV